MHLRRLHPEGFIALVSAIVISALLLLITTTLSFTGYLTRSGDLYAEYKERSLALAEACGDTALLKLANNPDYLPAAGGEAVSVGSNQCTMVSVSPVAGQTMILTTATYQRAVTNIKICAVPTTGAVSSWEECGNHLDLTTCATSACP